MLNEKEIKEIREHLESAKNPIFFFDNDADGLCSFLILRRFLGRGKGVSLKGLPSLTKEYYRKAEEFNSDYIFVLDRPNIDEEVIELNKKEKNLPIVCIDHHKTENKPEVEGYYNSYLSDGIYNPTSYLCFKVTGRKEDLWLAVIGCFGDWFMPEFFDEFKEKYPELIDAKYNSASDIVYKTELGKIVMIFDLGLKDTTTNAVSFIKYLIDAKSPSDVIQENSKTEVFLKRYDFLNKIVKKTVSDARKQVDFKNKTLFFTYSGKMSLSQQISNELTYNYPDFFIIVGFIKGNYVKFSLRGQGVRTLMMNSISGIEGASGGGHEFSCGAQMPADKLGEFREKLFKEIEKIRKEK